MDPSARADATGGPHDQRLESWKAIAGYLGRGVTTVQRWERDEQLPVRRHAHAARGSVFAFRREIDEWRRAREAIGLPAFPPGDPISAIAPRAAPAARSTTTESGGLRPLEDRVARRCRDVLRAGGWRLVVVGRRIRTTSRPQPLVWSRSRMVPSATSTPACRQTVGTSSTVPPTASPRVSYIRATTGGPASELMVDTPRPAERVDDFPQWSPDGRHIAFLRETRNSIWELRIAGASGGASRRLLGMATGAVSWMPDGAALVVLDRDSQSNPFSAYLVSAAGGERLRRVTTPASGTFGDWQCAVSPDGHVLAVVRYRSGHHADVWAVDIASGTERRLTSGMQSLEGVAWTPDNQAVVFSAVDEVGASLWTIAATPRPDERPTRVPVPRVSPSRRPCLGRTVATRPWSSSTTRSAPACGVGTAAPPHRRSA